MQISKRIKVILIAIAAPLLFVVAFALVTVAYSDFHKPSEVDVTPNSFRPQAIEINEGEAIHFVNKSSTLTQFLCIGTDKRCDSVAFRSIAQLPPAQLQSPGLRLAPDQAKDVVFDTDGTYHVTSTVAPGLNLTVTVNATT